MALSCTPPWASAAVLNTVAQKLKGMAKLEWAVRWDEGQEKALQACREVSCERCLAGRCAKKPASESFVEEEELRPKRESVGMSAELAVAAS